MYTAIKLLACHSSTNTPPNVCKSCCSQQKVAVWRIESLIYSYRNSCFEKAIIGRMKRTCLISLGIDGTTTTIGNHENRDYPEIYSQLFATEYNFTFWFKYRLLLPISRTFYLFIRWCYAFAAHLGGSLVAWCEKRSESRNVQISGFRVLDKYHQKRYV